MSERPDGIERRIVVEYGRRYVYLTLQDVDGKIVNGREEVFTQPFPLTKKESCQEAEDCWQDVYQWLSDVIVFPLPDSQGDKPESK
jgi:hypothetical protein